jgi:hypothetical protein
MPINIKKNIHTHIVHTYIRTYIYTHTLCKRTYIHTYIHTHSYTYIRTYVHTYIHTYTHSYTYIRTYVHTYIHIHVHTYIRSYVRTYIHMYTHTHTHTHSISITVATQSLFCSMRFTLLWLQKRTPDCKHCRRQLINTEQSRGAYCSVSITASTLADHHVISKNKHRSFYQAVFQRSFSFMTCIFCKTVTSQYPSLAIMYKTASIKWAGICGNCSCQVSLSQLQQTLY